MTRVAGQDAVVRRLPHTERVHVAELGVGQGGLSRRILEAHEGVHLMMVDSFKARGPGEPYHDWCRTHGDPYGARSAEQVAEDRLKVEQVVIDFPGRARIIAGDSAVTGMRLHDAVLFDLVFIDADHREEAARADIAAWWPHVRPGGWMGGHDIDRFDGGVRRAVDAFFDERGYSVEVDEDYTWFVRRPVGVIPCE